MKFRSLFVLAFVLPLVACAGGARHISTVSVFSAHATLIAVQATADDLVCGQPQAPAAPKCLTADQRKAIAAKLSPAFGTEIALATAVRDWPAGTPTPAQVPQYLAQITQLVTQVVNALPDSALKTKLVTIINGSK